MLGRLKIIESAQMVDGPFEDWSQVRSPGRARRRRRKGYPQRIQLYFTPKPGFVQLPDGTIVGHPATVRALNARLEAEGVKEFPMGWRL